VVETIGLRGRIAALGLTVGFLMAALAPVTAADAVSITTGTGCWGSAGNSYYAWYQAVTSSNDTDCTKVGVAWGDSGLRQDSPYPYVIDKVTTSEPGGSTSQHSIFDGAVFDVTQVPYSWYRIADSRIDGEQPCCSPSSCSLPDAVSQRPG